MKMKFLLKDSYLKIIKNSVGSKIFRSVYFNINGKKVDILKNGELSCAFFVSWILKNLGLIKQIHATVNGTVKDLKKSGWHRIKKPKIGSILIWEEKLIKNGKHRHIGFYIDKDKAISNSYKKKIPAIHHWTFGTKNGIPIRKVTEIWWNKVLD